jgi:hypothetical protein
MHWTWLKAAVVKIQIKKNGQGLKDICGWIKVDKRHFHTCTHFVSKLEVHIIWKAVTQKNSLTLSFFQNHI